LAGGTHGESVAFTSFYGGNWSKLADLLKIWPKTKGSRLYVGREAFVLLDTLGKKVNYDDPKAEITGIFLVYSQRTTGLSGKRKGHD